MTTSSKQWWTNLMTQQASSSPAPKKVMVMNNPWQNLVPALLFQRKQWAVELVRYLLKLMKLIQKWKRRNPCLPQNLQSLQSRTRRIVKRWKNTTRNSRLNWPALLTPDAKPSQNGDDVQTAKKDPATVSPGRLCKRHWCCFHVFTWFPPEGGHIRRVWVGSYDIYQLYNVCYIYI